MMLRAARKPKSSTLYKRQVTAHRLGASYMNETLRMWTAEIAFGLTFLGSLCAGAAEPHPVTVRNEQGRVEIENGRVRATLDVRNGLVQQEYSARGDGRWVTVASSLVPPHEYPGQALPLYYSGSDPKHRLVLTEGLRTVSIAESTDDAVKVLLSGMLGAHAIEQTIELARDADYFHIEVQATLAGEPPSLDYIVSPFTVSIKGEPDFTHAPAHKRSPNDVVGDRVFFAPAAIVQKGSIFVALVPDLDLVNSHIVYAKGARKHPDSNSFPVQVDPAKISLPAALDLDLQSGLSECPLMSYGVMDVVTKQHVFWTRDNSPGAMVRQLSSGKLHYGFDLFTVADARPSRGYQRVARHHWARYGRKNFSKPRPQAMPFAEYAKVCYPVAFAYQGYTVASSMKIDHRNEPTRNELNGWQEWEQDGTPVGGIRLTAPQWSDLIYYTAWWNNVGDATGIYYWGTKLDDAVLIDKARRIVNLALSAPQQNGIFPAFLDLKTKQWIGTLWQPPLEDYDPTLKANYWNWKPGNGTYQSASASVTTGFLMQYYRDCEQDPNILPFVQRYGDFLIENMQQNGCVPGWFSRDLQPLPSMRFNADGGAHAWVLTELYRATNKQKYLNAAEQMVRFLQRAILPQQKWFDFETFYSCGVKSESYFDARTGQPGRNLMSVSWALQGFLALYEATGNREYLDDAVATADYASLFQAVWAPHYVVTAYPFGGMSSQVGDAEWLDQRSHRFADSFVRVGLLSGRQDLVERGVAVARSSLALISHPRHKANGIYTHTNFPLGLGPENIDHEGFPQMPLASGPSWSSVGGLAAAAHVLNRLGGVFVNISDNWAVGVDGVRVSGFRLEGQSIHVQLENQLAQLPRPYTAPYEGDLNVSGLLDSDRYELIVNGRAARPLTTDAGRIRMTITLHD